LWQQSFGLAVFHAGLKEASYVEGQNVVVEYRFAEGHNEPGMAADEAKSRSRF